jgi:bifunctional non-homologous end joining protein LigD
VIWREKSGSVRPMLATLADPPLSGTSLVFEPKYDGIRAIAEITPGRGRATVRLWSRLGNEKTTQFPSIVEALAAFGNEVGRPLVLDGEAVALDERGRPTGFQRLQNRIHVIGAKDVERIDRSQPVAFIAFDILRDGDEDLRGLPLVERRKRLEEILRGKSSDGIRLSEQVPSDGRALYERATREHWEGLIVKDATSPYHSGRRSPAWRKLKLVQQQEFVVGGWTEPRQTRQHFGALLLGVHDNDRGGRLRYVGHTGTGFDQKELERVSRLLKAREIRESPFAEKIKTNEPAHWVRPDLVAQVRFTEWTDDRKLRHPVYLGLRDDKNARHVVQEVAMTSRTKDRPQAESPAAPAKPAARSKRNVRLRPDSGGPLHRRRKPEERRRAAELDTDAVVEQLRALEDARKDGTIQLPDGLRLGVTNLAKPFWPKLKLTKGDLLRYYARVAPFALLAVADRVLVMKRFPNGVDGPAFYQQKRVQEQPPPGVRTEVLPEGLDPMSEPGARRFVGGQLITLLYMTQLAAISQDPWFSRVQSPLEADYVALDLDPDDHAPFARVLDVARWVRDELESLKVTAVPKTSGSSGLHVYIPLPPGTSYESGQLFCQIVATVVAAKHPKVATVERKVKARPRGTVYVDFLQNILGKTLATAYSARASDFAGVSTPLTWKEVDAGVDPRDFTIVTAPDRFLEVGDLWARLRSGKPANLEAVFRKYGSQR